MLPWDAAWARTYLQQAQLISLQEEITAQLGKWQQWEISSQRGMPTCGTATLFWLISSSCSLPCFSAEWSNYYHHQGDILASREPMWWHDGKSMGSSPWSPHDSLAVCPELSHPFLTSGFQLSNKNINLSFLTLKDFVIIKIKCAASIMQ